MAWVEGTDLDGKGLVARRHDSISECMGLGKLTERDAVMEFLDVLRAEACSHIHDRKGERETDQQSANTPTPFNKQ